MVKIKLIVSEGYYDYDENFKAIAQGISDWEEVTEEDYQFIRDNLHHLRDGLKRNEQIFIVRQDTESIPERIEGIKNAITKRMKAEEKRKEEYQRKKEEAALKRKAARNAADKKKLTELMLIKSNPDLLKDILEQ